MAETVAVNELIENANVMWRNFAGAEKPFNSKGDRNFCIFLEPEMAEKLKKAGWNVKQNKPRSDDEDEVLREYIQVAVEYDKGRPPKVVTINSRGRMELGPDEVMHLDYLDIENWDVILNPYPWDVNGKQGIKAYLKSLFATIREDELDLKYADIPEAQDPTKGLSSTVSEEELVLA